MPSWNEKPVVIPEINVNLEHQCPSWCPKTHDGSHDVEHAASCYARPVLIPCPIPRSVTFEVALGECVCPANGGRGAASWNPPPACLPTCPARPIRVSCSISGETWAESEAENPEVQGREWASGRERLAALAACRERWALVKAVLSGIRAASYFTERSPLFKRRETLFAQRDAVFAALCEMAQAELAAWEAQKNLVGLLPANVPTQSGGHAVLAGREPSAYFLAAYVEHLIEQVGVLS